MVFSFSSDFRHCLPLAVSASRNTLFLYAVASTRRCGLSSLQGPSSNSVAWRLMFVRKGDEAYSCPRLSMSTCTLFICCSLHKAACSG